jgi:hypothetical protein
VKPLFPPRRRADYNPGMSDERKQPAAAFYTFVVLVIGSH